MTDREQPPPESSIRLVGEIEEADRTYRPSPPTFD